ncbi:PKD domain-containing protein [Brumimicrobium mesophilum]|uniref:PKD domain-containing protein n=1 Tax=Brumimicrobium mesophilum TaxID=392717 RepID=UPI000D141009|nr:PKD domain-containing protein [Brumimicrobium mesophilum]
MKHILLFTFLTSCLFSFGQTTIWSDDFEATAANWDLTIQTGVNEPDANIWTIDDGEGGVTPPGCSVTANGDKTLYVSCQGMVCPAVGTGAKYYPGDNGLATNPATTNIRAALTTPISTVGETQLELDFDWLGEGAAGADFTELEYSIDGGATWTVLWTQTVGPLCGGGEAQWSQENIALPLVTENQPDLRFALHWRNDNTNPGVIVSSFAINNMVLTSNSAATGPNADFSVVSFTICKDDCIDFTDASTGTNISAWNWSFTGSTTATSTDQNPTNICWNNVGTYSVTLSITDDNGTDNVTYQIFVQNCTQGPPTADFSTEEFVICSGTCIDFTDESTGDPTSWEWDFGGATPATSTSQNPSNICFDTPGTYAITLTVTNSGGSNQITTPVTVLDLPLIEGFGDTIIDLGGAAELNAIPGAGGSILWIPSSTIDCPTCPNVIATPSITTDYYPTITDINGCVGMDTVTVYVAFEEIVEVPSAFSPNGDGKDDVLKVLGIGIASIEFKIFNRYGHMVFDTTDLNEGWDGTMDGKEINQGVFVYTLSYTLIDGTKSEKSGNVTLVK